MANSYSIPFGDPGIAPGGDSTRGGALPPAGGAGGGSTGAAGGPLGPILAGLGALLRSLGIGTHAIDALPPVTLPPGGATPGNLGTRVPSAIGTDKPFANPAAGSLSEELSVIWDDLSRAAPEAGIYLLLAVMLIVGVASLLSGAK